MIDDSPKSSSGRTSNGRFGVGNPGRPAGTKNKLTLSAIEKLNKLGCDPLEGMAKIAMDQSNPIDLRARMYAELAQYVAPKLKSSELTGANGGPVQVESLGSELSAEEQTARIEALLAMRTAHVH